MLQTHTRYGGIVLASVGSWTELPWSRSSYLLVCDGVSCDGCGRWLPGEGNGGGGNRCELEACGSLDHWFSYEEICHVREHLILCAL